MEALTNISAFGRDKPSFFELVAQESMEELLRPCIAYLLNVIAQKYPNQRTISLVSWQDEIFASVASLLNFLYLRYTNCTFSEDFYGLQRVTPVPSFASSLLGEVKSSNQSNLTFSQLWRSVITTTLYPYLRSKLSLLLDQNHHHSHGGLKRIGQVMDMCFFLYKILYLYHDKDDDGGFFSPLLHLSGVKLVYKTSQQEEQGQSSLHLIRSILPTLLFFAKTWEWWRLNSHADENTKMNTFIPKVPLLPHENADKDEMKDLHLSKTGSAVDQVNEPKHGNTSYRLPSDDTTLLKCPLCTGTMVSSSRDNESGNNENEQVLVSGNPVILPTGYLFCYKCILEYLKRHNGKCPITQIHVDISSIRKVNF